MNHQINILKTRSFWAAVAAVATGVEQIGTDPTYTGLLTAVGGLLESTGAIPNATDFAVSVGPVITAALGIWAYVERLLGRRTVVLGKEQY